MEEIFGENGLIARYHEAYEHRDGQLKMADAVLPGVREKTPSRGRSRYRDRQNAGLSRPRSPLAVGKNRRVVISTGTKNLQEQLMEKDIPFLQS